MNKKEIEGVIEKIVNTIEKSIDSQGKVVDLQGRIVGLTTSLIRLVSIILFVLTLLVWRVFLWEPFNKLLGNVTTKWSLLSEGYRLFIMDFVGAIIAGIIAHIAGSLILKKIKKSLLENKC
jgi:hypothetical protein